MAKNTKFFGSISDLGSKHAVGIGHASKDHPENKEPDGFFGHISDMGSRHAEGMGDAKS